MFIFADSLQLTSGVYIGGESDTNGNNWHYSDDHSIMSYFNWNNENEKGAKRHVKMSSRLNWKWNRGGGTVPHYFVCERIF